MADSEYNAWASFFTQPSKDRECNSYRHPLAEAIRAYEGIGYRCVELELVEKSEDRPTYEELWKELEKIKQIAAWEKAGGDTLPEQIGNIIVNLENDLELERNFIGWLNGYESVDEAWLEFLAEMKEEEE